MSANLASVNITISESGQIKIGQKEFNSRAEAYATLASIVVRAGRQAARRTTTDYETKVAQETGAMRDGYARALMSAFNDAIAGSRNLAITMSRQDIRTKLEAGLPDYMKYHVDGAPKTNLPYYKTRSTEGTEPIDTSKILDIFADNFVNRRESLLRANRMI